MLRREGRLEPELAMPIVAEVAAALDAAHARGLVHRDVKPANVLLDAGRHVYLTDFGLSTRLGGDADEAGPASCSARCTTSRRSRSGARRSSPRTDVYALGAMLFHMLTGARAVPGRHGRGAAVGPSVRAAARAEPRRRRHPRRVRRGRSRAP